jgi:hypothetical protein
MLWPACLPLWAARKQFWDTKDPANWSDDEKQAVLSQSPWAREGYALMELGKSPDTGPGYGNDGRRAVDIPQVRPGAPPGGVKSVPLGEPMPPVPDPNARLPVKFRVLARWESARPVRLAGAPALPDSSGQFYIIRLRGLPLMPPPKAGAGEVAANPNENLLQAIKEGSRLERKDSPAIPCARLFAGPGDMATEVLLFFPRGTDPITAADRLVTLESRFANFHLSIKFPLTDMMFKGQLAL